jgi:monoterpene epsilon-lactone hydrolase
MASVGTIVVLVAVVTVIWVIAVLFLVAPDHSIFDDPQPELHRDPSGVSVENSEVLRLVGMLQDAVRGVSIFKRIDRLRQIFDEGFSGSPAGADELGVAISATNAGGVDAEWVMAPGASHERRLLYIHGGAFAIGSAVSHRMITSALSKSCGVAVLAINYRLLPQHFRRAAIADCQSAYRYMLEHGPSGKSAAEEIYVAGDSAGGNLTLMLSAWARDQGLRPMDGVIAFSPATDSTLSSPSVVRNIETDPMLGPGLGRLARPPASVRALLAMSMCLSSPRNPLMSPQFGDLGNLPPTLVQVSDCEMLFGDSLRYVNKARAQGSPVTLQVWPGMVHVWPMFQHVLPEARQAIEEVAAFIAANSKPTAAARVSSG